MLCVPKSSGSLSARFEQISYIFKIPFPANYGSDLVRQSHPTPLIRFFVRWALSFHRIMSSTLDQSLCHFHANICVLGKDTDTSHDPKLFEILQHQRTNLLLMVTIFPLSKLPPYVPAWADAAYVGRRAFAFCSLDNAIPPAAQTALIQQSEVPRDVETFASGHAPVLSVPRELSAWTVQKISKFQAVDSQRALAIS